MERIRNLQQNLWQTKLYINYERETLAKLQEELGLPLKRVGRNAWITNYKWRYLRTIQMNTRSLLECDKYARSLENTVFVDARERIGTNTEKYAQFLKFLRDKPNLIAVIFLTQPGDKPRDTKDSAHFIHYLLSVLFGFAVFPEDERRLIRVISRLAHIQIAEYMGSITSFFGSKPSPLSLSFRLFIEWSSSTRVYLTQLMEDVLLNIISEPDFLDVDEKSHFTRLSPEQKQQLLQRPGCMKGKVEANRQRIAQHVCSIIAQLTRHLHSFPPLLRWLGSHIVQYLRTYKAATQDEINTFLGELLYTRMLTYTLLQPSIYLRHKVEISEVSQYNLKQVMFAFREAFLSETCASPPKQRAATVLPYIGAMKGQLITLLEQFVDIPFSSSPFLTVDIPLQRSSLLVLERDLHDIISSLMELLASGVFQPEEKEMLASALSLLPSEPCRYLHRQKRQEKSRSNSIENNVKRSNSRSNSPSGRMGPRGSITIPGDDEVIEEVLVVQLSDVVPDPIQFEREVLGKEPEQKFDDRKMSVLSTGDNHPLVAPQYNIKGLLQDFDFSFQNPELASLSSATSYDSGPSDTGLITESNSETASASGVLPETEGAVSPASEHTVDSSSTVTTEGSQHQGSQHQGSQHQGSQHQGSQHQVEIDNGNVNGELLFGLESLSVDTMATPVLRVNMPGLDRTSTFGSDRNSVSSVWGEDKFNTARKNTEGLFFGDIQGTLRDRLGSQTMAPRHQADPVEELGKVPFDLIRAEYIYRDYTVVPALSEEQVLRSVCSKLRQSFSLSSHFTTTYYPSIGGGATTVDLISLSPTTATSSIDDVNDQTLLLDYLHSEYSEAMIHNSKNCTQLEQAIIAVKRLPASQVTTVLSTLENEHKEQAKYISYLTCKRVELLRAKEWCTKVLAAIELKNDSFWKTLGHFSIDDFLKTINTQFKEYKEKFLNAPMVDEKCEVYQDYMGYLHNVIEENFLVQTIGVNHTACDPCECSGGYCVAVTHHKKELVKVAETHFFSSVYNAAFLPNGEINRQKDQVFAEGLTSLQETATLNHPDILIPAKFSHEAPWLPAQKCLSLTQVYKSPSGKFSCVLQCVATIFKLLYVGAAGDTILEGNTDEGSIPGADDLLPVLIYVIIHANPPDLLSTIDFIENFASKSMTGKDQYMLMQFYSAVEFIKSMLHRVAVT